MQKYKILFLKTKGQLFDEGWSTYEVDSLRKPSQIILRPGMVSHLGQEIKVPLDSINEEIFNYASWTWPIEITMTKEEYFKMKLREEINNVS